MGSQKAAKGKAKFDWSSQQHLCSSCSAEYIETGDNTVRLWRRDSSFVTDDVVGDPMLRMEEGIPVLYHHPVHNSFEPRILKVDNKLEFLYLLQDPNSLGSARLSAQEPVILRLHQIMEIHTQAAAIGICDAHGITNSHLTLDSATVIQFGGNKEEATPPMDKILILMVAHQQRLKMCIDTCLSVLPAEAEAELGNRYAAQQPGSRSRGRQQKDERSILGRVILPNVGQVFDPAQERIDLYVSVRATKVDAKLGVNHDLKIEECEDEVERIRATMNTEIPGTNLFPMDCARLLLVLSETVMLRHTAMHRVSPAFGGGFWRLLQPAVLSCAIVQDSAFEAAYNHNRQELMRDPPKWDNPHERCCDFTMRACLLAVEQMLDMETDYHEMALWAGRELGSEYLIPDRVTLSGTVEPWMEADAGEASAGRAGALTSDEDVAADAGKASAGPKPLAVLGQQLESRAAAPEERSLEASDQRALGDDQHAADPIHAGEPPGNRRPPPAPHDREPTDENSEDGDYPLDPSQDDFDSRRPKTPVSAKHANNKQAGFCVGARVCTSKNGGGGAGECAVQ